jgi:hypothetical protein
MNTLRFAVDVVMEWTGGKHGLMFTSVAGRSLCASEHHGVVVSLPPSIIIRVARPPTQTSKQVRMPNLPTPLPPLAQQIIIYLLQGHNY